MQTFRLARSLLAFALLGAGACGGNVVVDPPADDLPPSTGSTEPLPPPPTPFEDLVWDQPGEVDTVTVPAGVTSVAFLVWGGGGGSGAPGPGGGGAWINARIAVSAGDALEVRVASGGEAFGGGGGASYVLRNGEIMVVAAGGGGGGVDGCSGCEGGPLVGSGGGGGAVGEAGQNGTPNNEGQVRSEGGGGATATLGGIAGRYSPQGSADPCAADGSPGKEHEGGPASICGGGPLRPAQGYLGGEGLGNGTGGGGGAGFFGGGSGASQFTYSGGGGGGGSSWIHPSIEVFSTEGGSGQLAGGAGISDYMGNAGRGGDGIRSYEMQGVAGSPGLIQLRGLKAVAGSPGLIQLEI